MDGCAFQHGTEMFKERNFAAAGRIFIALADKRGDDLGRSSASNTLLAILSQARRGPSNSCMTLYQQVASGLLARHCPLPLQTDAAGECYDMYRMHLHAEHRRNFRQADKAKDNAALLGRVAGAMQATFEKLCAAGGPLNTTKRDPLKGGCDEALLLVLQLQQLRGDAAAVEQVRAIFNKPGNRLTGSREARMFAPDAPVSDF